MHIGSYGGAVSENVQLYNLINSMYSTRCTTYLNHGYSAGAMTFMMGQERIIYKHSDIMFHFFSGGNYGKGSDMIASITHSVKSISSYYKTVLKDYFTDEELELMVHHGKEFWMDSAMMMNKGIATSIIVDGKHLSSEEYFEMYDENGELLESYIAKRDKDAADLRKTIEKELTSMSKSQLKAERKQILELAAMVHEQVAKEEAEALEKKKAVKKVVKKPATKVVKKVTKRVTKKAPKGE